MEFVEPLSQGELARCLSASDVPDLKADTDLNAAWRKMAASADGPSKLMTPLSKSGAGLTSSLEDMWEPYLETPDPPAALPSRRQSPHPVIKTPSLARMSSMRMVVNAAPESPQSRQDLFKHDFTSDAPEEGLRTETASPRPALFDQLTGFVDDSAVSAATELAPEDAAPAEGEAAAAPDAVLDELQEDVSEACDMFENLDDMDFNIGLTQIHMSSRMSLDGHLGSSQHTTGVPPPRGELLPLTSDVFGDRASLGPHPPSEIDYRHPSSMFQQLDTAALCTPRTPSLLDKTVPGRSSLGSVLPPSQFELNLELPQPTPSVCGFTTGRGRPVAPPSEAKLRAAQAILAECLADPLETPASRRSVGFSTASGKRVSVSEEALEAERKRFCADAAAENLTPPSLNVGFASASGKKMAAPSEASLLEARRVFNEDMAGASTPRELPPMTGGFASAGGKKLAPPSAKSMEQAQALFSKTAADDCKPAGDKGNPPRAPSIDSRRLTQPRPLAAASRPSIPRSSLGSAPRNSFSRPFSLGKPPRSSFSPAMANRASPMVPKPKAPDIQYFDLTKPPYRIRLQDLEHEPGSARPAGVQPALNFDRLHQMLLAKGVDSKCVGLDWVKNHAELISWKIRATMHCFHSKRFYAGTDSEIVAQLLYRYEREVCLTQRSPLKKICEGDDTPVGLFVFVVRAVAPGELLLSDGWYSLWASIDAGLASLVSQGRLVAGQKIQVTNMSLAKGEPVHILEAGSAGFKAQICYNSTRMAKWHERLGRRRAPTFLRPLNHVREDGGPVPCMELIVSKVFSEVIALRFDDGRRVEKSRREWDDMLDAGFASEEERPSSVSKTIKVHAVDMASSVSVALKLYDVIEDLAVRLSEGRVLQVLNAKPGKSLYAPRLEFRIYQSGKHCIPRGTAAVPDHEAEVDFGSLTPGLECSVPVQIVRHRKNEKHVWGLVSSGDLLSIEVGDLGSTLQRLEPNEIVLFKNLKYQGFDAHVNIRVFLLTIYSDWIRRHPPHMHDFDHLNPELREDAAEFVDSLTLGKKTNSP